MRDLFFFVIVIVGLIFCYHKLTILSHRLDMTIMIQKSQQLYLDKLWQKDLEKNKWQDQYCLGFSATWLALDCTIGIMGTLTCFNPFGE